MGRDLVRVRMWSGSSGRGPLLRIAWGVLRNSGGPVARSVGCLPIPGGRGWSVRLPVSGMLAGRCIGRACRPHPWPAGSADGAGCRI